MFYFLLLLFFVGVSAENMCIDGEIYLEAHGPLDEYEPTVNNTKVITHPKNATLKSVGNKLCGFLIDTVDPATCFLPVTVKFIAIEFTESSRDGSYCTYYDDQAICVCDFFACNSVNGMLWEIAYSTMLREEHVIASPAPDGSYLGSLDERDRAASDCFMRLYEYSLGRNVSAAKRPTHYSPLAYRRAQLEFHANESEIEALKKRGETEFPLPEVCLKCPTPSPPPPAPTCPPPAATTACPVAKSSTNNIVSIFAWVFGARIVLWNQL